MILTPLNKKHLNLLRNKISIGKAYVQIPSHNGGRKIWSDPLDAHSMKRVSDEQLVKNGRVFVVSGHPERVVTFVNPSERCSYFVSVSEHLAEKQRLSEEISLRYRNKKDGFTANVAKASPKRVLHEIDQEAKNQPISKRVRTKTKEEQELDSFYLAF